MFNFDNLEKYKKQWDSAEPFPHIVIDNFLNSDFVQIAANEFPNFDDNFWFDYSNPLEIKKACSDWNKFPPSIYKIIFNLLSVEFTNKLELLTNQKLTPDYGLHGGGLHCHKSGGKLNAHLDYSLHPKLNLQRKINVIVYLSENWNPEWNGSLGFWSHDNVANQPDKLIKTIDCIFNRAVIFDTTMNSWHGLPESVNCPYNKSRNSIATYYLCEPNNTAQDRYRALYAPNDDQKNIPEIIDLINKRVNNKLFNQVYKV